MFILLRVAPGDPVDAILGSGANEVSREILRNKLGLNEESRGHYHDEIVREVEEKFNKLISEDETPFYVADEKFNRSIGTYAGKKYTVEGDEWGDEDGSYDEYCQKFLPTDEDEELLKELFKKEWIEHRAVTQRMIDSGIGQLQ